jgi:glutamine amidotransferase
MGNVRSVQNAFDSLGHDAVVTSDPSVIAEAERLVLPGVGAFGDAMENLRMRGLVDVLRQQVLEAKKPFLGICLGMQLLAKSSSEHGTHLGLGWIDAEVTRFNFPATGLKVPHMGWDEIVPHGEHPLMEGLRADQFVFYFVHSFFVVCRESRDVAASCEYGTSFTAAIEKGNIFATQFHPEKSQDNGIQLLQNFAEWRP